MIIFIKIYRRIVFLFMVFFVISTRVNGFELIKTTIGAEAAGLGGAMAATVNDPSAIYWNPAGLANINGQEKSKKKPNISDEAEQKFADDSFEKLFENSEESKDIPPPPEPSNQPAPFELQLYTSYGYLTFDRHLMMVSTAFKMFNGTFGVGLLGTFADNIQGYDSTGVSTGDLTYGAYAANIAYAWQMNIVKVGISLAGYLENIHTEDYYGGGLNFGIQMTPIPILHIGAAVQSLPGFMQQSATDSSDYRKLDTIAKLTLGITTPPPDASLMLLLGLEANLSQPDNPDIYANIGIQVRFAKYFTVMAGLRDNNFALGLGFNLPFVKIAYAINQDRLQTGFQHFIDLNFTF
jgi:hypothetical protein